jgi:hypothetical protein
MRESSVSDSSIYIFHKGSFKSSSGTERNGKWFGLEMRDGAFRFSVDDNDHKSVVSGSTSHFVTGEWVHVALVRDVFQGRLDLYRNGYVSATAGDNTGGIRVNMPLLIGNSDHMYPQYYDGNSDENTPYRGELAEFVICGHPLSRDEIRDMYQYNRIPTLDPPAGEDIRPLVSGLRAYPNPFTDRVCFEFDNGAQHRLLVEIYDASGKLVCLKEEAVIPHAINRIWWDGSNGQGAQVPGSIFMIRLRDGSGRDQGRVVFIRNT